MKNIALIMKNNNGFMRMKDLKKAGFHTRIVSDALKQGIIEKIKPGLYHLVNFQSDENISFYMVYQAIPSAVVALTSAAAYHDLTTANPSEVMIAVPHNKSNVKLAYPPVKIFFFSDACYKSGVQTIKTQYGRFRIFSPEKTICDLFRYRRKIGEAIAIEAVRSYVSRRDRDLNKLIALAKRCKVDKFVTPILKGLVG